MNGSLANESGLIFESPAMREALLHLHRAAQTNSPILLTGETGTGKTELAKMAHQLSSRREKNFVDANIAGNPESILESVLFGHVRGAYTGALRDRVGKFEEADGGTIFLDEIGDLSLAAQITILKLIEEKKLERIGNGSAIDLNIRVISATNRNLREGIKKGFFRRDLFFRLNELEIHVPALRERAEDILPLAIFFLQQNVPPDGKQYFLSSKAEQFLLSYDWPGNIRQLRSVLLNAVMRSTDRKLRARDLGKSIGPKDFATRWIEGEKKAAANEVRAISEEVIPQSDLIAKFLAEDERAKTERSQASSVAVAQHAQKDESKKADTPEKLAVSGGDADHVTGESSALVGSVAATAELFSVAEVLQAIRKKEKVSLAQVIKSARRILVNSALAKASNNGRRTAALLGISPHYFSTMRKKWISGKDMALKDDIESNAVYLANEAIKNGQGCDIKKILDDFRRQLMSVAREAVDGNNREAANLLCVSYETVYLATRRVQSVRLPEAIGE